MNLHNIKEMHNLIMVEYDHEAFGKIKVAYVQGGDVLLHGNTCATILGYKDPRTSLGRKVGKDYRIILKPTNFINPKRKFGVVEKTTPNTKNSFGADVLSAPNNKNNFGVSKTDTPKSKITILSSKEINNFGETFITPEGFTELVLSSKLPEAQEFKRLVLEEIIPSVAKTGEYKDPRSKKQIFMDFLSFKDFEDLDFKYNVNGLITMISVQEKTIKGKVWRKFVSRFNRFFGTNLTTKKSAFMKAHNLKSLTYREFLDIFDMKEEAILCLTSMAKFPDESFNEEDIIILGYMYKFIMSKCDEDKQKEIENKVNELVAKTYFDKKFKNIRKSGGGYGYGKTWIKEGNIIKLIG